MSFYNSNYLNSVQNLFHHHMMFNYYKDHNPEKARHHYNQYHKAMKNYAADYGDRELEMEFSADFQFDATQTTEKREKAELQSEENRTYTTTPIGHIQTIYGLATIRFLQAAPNLQSVDIYINNQLMFQNFSYKQLTQYIELPPGLYQIKITKHNEPSEVFVTKNIHAIPNLFYTNALTESANGVELFLIQDSTDVENNEAKLRFLHLAGQAPDLSIAAVGGDTIFPNVPYQSISDYLKLSPMTIGLQVKHAKTEQPLLEVSSFSLSNNTAYTLIAIGGTTQLPLELIVISYVDK